MPEQTVRISLLGPVEIAVEGETIPIRSRKMKSLLAMLALNANRTVATETLVRELWPSEHPSRSRNACHATVSRLRRLLMDRDANVVDTKSVGYALNIDTGGVDLFVFHNLVQRVETLRAQDPVTARIAADTAFCLWRGQPLGGVEVCPYLESESVRLVEQNTHLQLNLAELMMEERRFAEVSLMLAPLTKTLFGWERVHALYMSCLYAQGRQLEALEHFRSVARNMRQEFGLQPPTGLAALHAGILSREPGIVGGPIPAVPR